MDKVIDFLNGHSMSQKYMYIIGGDGMHRGAYMRYMKNVSRTVLDSTLPLQGFQR